LLADCPDRDSYEKKRKNEADSSSESEDSNSSKRFFRKKKKKFLKKKKFEVKKKKFPFKSSLKNPKTIMDESGSDASTANIVFEILSGARTDIAMGAQANSDLVCIDSGANNVVVLKEENEKLSNIISVVNKFIITAGDTKLKINFNATWGAEKSVRVCNTWSLFSLWLVKFAQS
jgi:hypothetical protein